MTNRYFHRLEYSWLIMLEWNTAEQQKSLIYFDCPHAVCWVCRLIWEPVHLASESYYIWVLSRRSLCRAQSSSRRASVNFGSRPVCLNFNYVNYATNYWVAFISVPKRPRQLSPDRHHTEDKTLYISNAAMGLPFSDMTVLRCAIFTIFIAMV